MAYCSEFDTYQYESFDQGVNEWNEEKDSLSWGVDAHKHQQRCYNSYQGLDQASPCQLSDSFTPLDFYLMGPDMCPPYYGSPPTLYDSSSSNSNRPSPPVDSPASSFLRTPELYHREVLILSPGMNSYALGPDYGTPATGSCVAMQNIQRCADAQFEETIDDFGSYDTLFEPQELVPATREEDKPSSPTPYYHHHHQIPIVNAEARQKTARPDAKTEPEPQPERLQTPPTRHSRCHRRAAKETPLTNIHSSRITKRSSLRNLGSTPKKCTQVQSQSIKEEDNDDEAHLAQPPLRSFPCPLSPYGCTASFSAKNEWKRHAATQHFRLAFWRCDMCTPENKPINSHKKASHNNSSDRKRTASNNTTLNDLPNDFNRKDLFVQHVRRMHPASISLAIAMATTHSNTGKKIRRSHSKPPATTSTSAAAISTSLSHIATRCHRATHSSPPAKSLCVFCGERFEGGAEGLESRLEHMGKHMDARKKAELGPVGLEEWRADEGLEEWMVRSGILARGRGGRLVMGG